MAAATRVASALVVARVSIPWRAIVAALPGRARTVFSDVQPQSAAGDLPAVELLDGLSGVLFSGEPNEREASGAARFAVLGNVNVNHLADLPEELT